MVTRIATESSAASCLDGSAPVKRAELRASVHAPFRYVAYGMKVTADIELWPNVPEPLDQSVPSDTIVSLGQWPLNRAEPGVGLLDAHFRWQDLAEVSVSNGARIDVCAVPGADHRELSAAVAGPGLAAAFGQRGLLVLHGTCVAFGDQAVCLLGESGAGKSTLAAALCASGAQLVSDTMTVVELQKSNATVRVGPAQFKLWPDAALALGYDSKMQRALPGTDKRLCPFVGRMAAPSARLLRAFVVVPEEPVAAVPLSPAAAAAALARNLFLAGYLKPELRLSSLALCARMAEQVPVRVLHRGNSLAALPMVLRSIRASDA